MVAAASEAIWFLQPWSVHSAAFPVQRGKAQLSAALFRLICTDISLSGDAKTETADWSNFYTKTPPNFSFSLTAPKPTFLIPSNCSPQGALVPLKVPEVSQNPLVGWIMAGTTPVLLPAWDTAAHWDGCRGHSLLLPLLIFPSEAQIPHS